MLKVVVEMEEVAVVVVVFERKGLPRSGIFLGTFFAAPSPLSLLLFKLVVVSISYVWFAGFFFFIFLDVGDAAVADGTGAADVVGVAGVADVFGVVLGAGVVGTFGEVGAGVFGDSGAAGGGGWALFCF